MRIPTDPKFPSVIGSLVTRLYDLWRPMAYQVNNFVEGRISACTNAQSTVPTTGMYQQGDFVRNSTPSVLGTPGSQYVVFGWQSVAGGEPGTFVEVRYLTGT